MTTSIFFSMYLKGLMLAFCLLNSSSVAFCPRFMAGDTVSEPTHLYSSQGRLTVTLDYYYQKSDSTGQDLFCFTTPDGAQSPVLHLNPGEYLNIKLKNHGASIVSESSFIEQTSCEEMMMKMTDDMMINIHFHGLRVEPSCHQDEVVLTNVMPGRFFTYQIQIPASASPGLYSYHAHIHKIAEKQLKGGASGIIVVEGLENILPWTESIPERFLMFRDQALPSMNSSSSGGMRMMMNMADPMKPSLDLSINYVPITYPMYMTAMLAAEPDQYELWRVTNLCAATILNIQLMYDDVPQEFQVISIDGVPLANLQFPNRTKTYTNLLLPVLRRVEFIVKTPSTNVLNATLLTRSVDMGPPGKIFPFRPLINITAAMMSGNNNNNNNQLRLPKSTFYAKEKLIDLNAYLLLSATPRKIFFSQNAMDPNIQMNMPHEMFITLDGQTPKIFDAKNPPDFAVQQGTIEEWVIENRAPEVHVFHIHQLNFLLVEVDGIKLDPKEMIFEDVVFLNYWSGNSNDPYPSVKIRIDFRKSPPGEILYHCHLLDHEDLGMMSKFIVVSQSSSQNITLIVSLTTVLGSLIIGLGIFGYFKIRARKLKQQQKQQKGYEEKNNKQSDL